MWKVAMCTAILGMSFVGNKHLEDKVDVNSDLVINMKNDTIPVTNLVDYDGFMKLGEQYRVLNLSHRVGIKDFMQFANDPNTIILDTRSAKAFEETHFRGAIHLNFSDFTEQKLANVIPSKDTRILIYCNNNFDVSDPDRYESLMSKMPPLALNIPTYINLLGYGYEHVFELASLLPVDHPMLVVNN